MPLQDTDPTPSFGGFGLTPHPSPLTPHPRPLNPDPRTLPPYPTASLAHATAASVPCGEAWNQRIRSSDGLNQVRW